MNAIVEPSPARRQHDRIRRSDTIADVDGRIGHPWHCQSLLDNLLARREIGATEYAAGLQFGVLARRAAVPTLHASDPRRPRGGAPAASQDGGSERARYQLGKALDALGGLANPMGSLAWDVLGRDESLSAWAQRQSWIGGRGTGAAKGVLMSCLPLLALHFGLTRPITTR